MHRDAGIAKVRHLTTGLAGISLAAVVGGAMLAHQATVSQRHANTAPQATVSQPTATPTNQQAATPKPTAKTTTSKTPTTKATAPTSTSKPTSPKPTPTKTKKPAATSGGS